jgi:hypothetical protein
LVWHVNGSEDLVAWLIIGFIAAFLFVVRRRIRDSLPEPSPNGNQRALVWIGLGVVLVIGTMAFGVWVGRPSLDVIDLLARLSPAIILSYIVLAYLLRKS